jgi:hypothetical protein
MEERFERYHPDMEALHHGMRTSKARGPVGARVS